MTLARNNIVRLVRPHSIFESAKPLLSASVSWNQGDLLRYDAGTQLLKPIVAVADSATAVGVAKQTVVNGVVKSPYLGTAVDASAAIEDLAGPVFGVVASFLGTVGDALTAGCLLYPGADAQTVTVTAALGAEVVGVYQGGAVASVVSGQLVAMLVTAQYPAALV